MGIDRHRGNLNLKRSILYKPGDFFADEVLYLRNCEPAVFSWWLLKGTEETMGKHPLLQPTALIAHLILMSCPKNKIIWANLQMWIETLQGYPCTSAMTDIQ